MFCDECDRGYHTFCVGLTELPTGESRTKHPTLMTDQRVLACILVSEPSWPVVKAVLMLAFLMWLLEHGL